MTTSEPDRAASPCIRRCVLDAQGEVCLGCGRKLADIMNWAAMSDAERRAIMTALQPRPDLPSGGTNQG